MKAALICVDLVNDIISKEGKLADKGYAEFAEKNETLRKIHRIQEQFRAQGHIVIHTKLGFEKGYVDFPKDAKVMERVKRVGALQMGEWGAEIADSVKPENGDVVLDKCRISAFYRTRLDLILRSQGIEEVFIVGGPTDISIASTARDAQDRDFKTTVIKDACYAINEEVHNHSLETIETMVDVKDFSDIAVKVAMG